MQRTKYTHSRLMCVLWNCVMELRMQIIELTKKRVGLSDCPHSQRSPRR